VKATKQIRLPSIQDRTVIIGATGSGKTVAGLWHLSRQPIDQMPWLIIDYKGDDNISSIPYAQHVAIGAPLLNGVYVVHPMLRDKEALEQQLWNIWNQEQTGILVDEGFMLADSEAFNTILMQGRSKRIPVIVLTQRPVFVSRFVFSEASFIQVFRVIDKRDRKTISEFTPIFGNKNSSSSDETLPPFYSYYYDVAAHHLVTLKPVPPMPAINRAFAEKLKPVIEERKGMRAYI
jgi:hypothetical protein